ncbi:hypothetical protein SDC9_151687 [bioreactor metagenome]|uniref:Uncharacterized protein n=1 Tax=bioreactor metagenome TaxID=1076179 RepID=A0A645ETB9_9ZZZZ
MAFREYDLPWKDTCDDLVGYGRCFSICAFGSAEFNEWKTGKNAKYLRVDG